MKLNGSEILIECLIEQQVDTVFGFPGGAVLNIYDALYKYRSSIRHILTSHEQGASHAADGYAVLLERWASALPPAVRGYQSCDRTGNSLHGFDPDCRIYRQCDYGIVG
jgi:hypothetical protein